MVLEFLFGNKPHYDVNEDDIVEDDDAVDLSYVGKAAYEILRTKHAKQHHTLWNATSGKVVGQVHQTPSAATWVQNRDPMDGHSDWFPQKLGEIISRTEIFCDVMSLGPPDGMFMEEFQKALKKVAETSKTKEKDIIVRMMFGNIVGMPVNCNAVIKKLTKDLPNDAKLQLWVGAWRKGVSWNHAKIIAVDGQYLHTGGHNLWDGHYLKHDPVHDLSLEIQVRDRE